MNFANIMGIGIDSIEIDRFKAWPAYSIKNLKKVFSCEEIAYCLETPLKSPERFAVRFAAKESAYKALNQILTKKITFLGFCKAIQIKKNSLNAPFIDCNWDILKAYLPKDSIKWSISITHTRKIATALIILYKKV